MNFSIKLEQSPLSILSSFAFGLGAPKLYLVIGSLIPPFGPEPAKPAPDRALAKLLNGEGFETSIKQKFVAKILAHASNTYQNAL